MGSRAPAPLVPRRWWELTGPVAVWTVGEIWPSWDLEAAHEIELARLEVGDAVAELVVLSRRRDCSAVGRAVYCRPPPKPEVVGQMRLL